MVGSYAEGYATGPIETTYMGPGSYWVHTTIPQKGFARPHSPREERAWRASRWSFRSRRNGAADPYPARRLRYPKVSLPPTVATPEQGEEPSYTMYVVPDFDSTAEVTPITLRPSSGGIVYAGRPHARPYHVYAFPSPVELEYRNPEALAALPNPGQAVTLSPPEQGAWKWRCRDTDDACCQIHRNAVRPAAGSASGSQRCSYARTSGSGA